MRGDARRRPHIEGRTSGNCFAVRLLFVRDERQPERRQGCRRRHLRSPCRKWRMPLQPGFARRPGCGRQEPAARQPPLSYGGLPTHRKKWRYPGGTSPRCRYGRVCRRWRLPPFFRRYIGRFGCRQSAEGISPRAPNKGILSNPPCGGLRKCLVARPRAKPSLVAHSERTAAASWRLAEAFLCREVSSTARHQASGRPVPSGAFVPRPGRKGKASTKIDFPRKTHPSTHPQNCNASQRPLLGCIRPLRAQLRRSRANAP